VAVIRKLELKVLEKYTRHTDAEGTYSVVYDPDGTKVLQIDTYGSEGRRIPGKVSQSIRVSPEGLKQLRIILKDHFEDS
jgi:hypothetical protein